MLKSSASSTNTDTTSTQSLEKSDKATPNNIESKIGLSVSNVGDASQSKKQIDGSSNTPGSSGDNSVGNSNSDGSSTSTTTNNNNNTSPIDVQKVTSNGTPNSDGGSDGQKNKQQQKTPKHTQSFTQDIVHSYEANLATDTYELPDTEALGVRMLGVSLEHGLIQGVDPISAEIMLAGLEHYLKDLVQQAFDRVKRRRSSSQDDIITVEDISKIMESSPNCFVELNGPFYRLNDTLLMNDDEDEFVTNEMTENGDIDQLLDGIIASHT